MGKKFLQTRSSRKRFLVWSAVIGALLMFAIIMVVAFSDGANLFGAKSHFSDYWWVNVAQVIVMMVITIVGVVLAVIVICYGLFFFTGDPKYEYTLRAYAGWYDTFCLKLMAGGRSLVENVLAPIGRVIAWPFRKTSTGIHRWINSGL
jgi:hypothetical protein